MTSERWLPWCLVFVLIAILIICFNVLTIIVLTRAKPLHSHIRSLITSLAVADLTVGLLTLPLYVYHIAASYNGVELTIYRMLDVFTGYASIFFLVAIAVERLVAVAWPLKHENTKQKTYIFAIAVVWFLAAFLGLLMVLKTLRVITLTAFYIPMIGSFFASIVALSGCYSVLWCVASAGQVTRNQAGGEPRSFDKQLGVTLLLVTVLFIAMWLPFQVLNILHYYNVQCGAHCNYELVNFFKLLHYGNSLVNPIVYSVRVPGFKKAAVEILCRRSPAAATAEGDVTMNTIASNKGEVVSI